MVVCHLVAVQAAFLFGEDVVFVLVAVLFSPLQGVADRSFLPLRDRFLCPSVGMAGGFLPAFVADTRE